MFRSIKKAKFVPTKGISVVDAVTNQFLAEAKGLKHDQEFLLRQKYGLVSPQLELGEQGEVRAEERYGTDYIIARNDKRDSKRQQRLD